MGKVLMIGLDGATWDLIKPWANEGHLPTFKRLMEEGVHGELESTIPPWSIPAWNALSTGKNPGKLGFFSFASREKGSYRFKPDFLYAKERDVWNILSEMGKTVIVVNVPNVHKALRIKGYLVAGFLYLSKGALTYPKTLKNKLDEVVGGYEVDVLDADATFESVEKRFEFVKASVSKEKDKKYVERVHRVMDKRFEAVKFLLKKKWDFAFVVFVAPDRVQHRFWMDKKILLDCYKSLDDKLEKLLTMIDEETTVILVSDHGFGLKKRVFNINEWSLKEGYLGLKTKNNSKWAKIANLIRGFMLLPLVESMMKLMPSRLSRSLKDRVKYAIVEDSNIDWEKTRIFTQPSEEVCGDIYLNVTGREPKGTINPQEYEKTRNEIIRKLRNLEDPTNGKKVSAKVYKKEEIYTGEYLDLAPDLIIQVDDNIQGFNARVGYDRIFIEGKGGEHRTNGIFFAYGSQIKRGIEIERVKIYDIAPTILHIFNLPIARDMDGKVLKEIFLMESEIGRREIKYQAYVAERGEEKEQIRSDEEEERIEERLRKLGYI